jgi:pseudouridine-5'-phosphate glycosidase
VGRTAWGRRAAGVRLGVAHHPDNPTGADVSRRPIPARVALESTLLLHGVPRASARGLHQELGAIARRVGARPELCAVLHGRALHDVSDQQLDELLAMDPSRVPKLNTSTLGVALSRGGSGATTVSATMEIAFQAGVRVFATGALGGVHHGLSVRPDISADLGALARFPVAVVTAGCKSLLDIIATRELLESLGVPVVGFRTDRFPAFYQRDGGCDVDARFDDLRELATFVEFELNRSARRGGGGVVIANPIPPDDELDAREFAAWLALAEAEARASGANGRDVTPRVLGALHRVSGGATLRANIALVKHNVEVASALSVELSRLAGAPRDTSGPSTAPNSTSSTPGADRAGG